MTSIPSQFTVAWHFTALHKLRIQIPAVKCLNMADFLQYAGEEPSQPISAFKARATWYLVDPKHGRDQDSKQTISVCQMSTLSTPYSHGISGAENLNCPNIFDKKPVLFWNFQSWPSNVWNISFITPLLKLRNNIVRKLQKVPTVYDLSTPQGTSNENIVPQSSICLISEQMTKGHVEFPYATGTSSPSCTCPPSVFSAGWTCRVPRNAYGPSRTDGVTGP